MSFASLLLRLLLSLCLALNGLPAAAMHAPMQQAMAATVEAPVTGQAAAEAMPCHGHDETAAAAPVPAESATTAAAAEHLPQHAPDCCQSGTCRCACVHVAQAGVPSLQLPAAAIDHDRSVRALALGHAAPALPHPIRPPIG